MASTFRCCDSEVPFPERGQVVTCPECSTEFEHDGIDLGAGARVRYQPEFKAMGHDQFAEWMTALPEGPGWREGGADFPEGFQGAGPMFAAVPLGERWLDIATDGATTYILHDPYSFRGPEEEAQQLHEKYAGFSAFLDRSQAEQVADHPARSSEFYRWEGPTGVPDCTAKRDAEIAAATDWDGALAPEAGQ